MKKWPLTICQFQIWENSPYDVPSLGLVVGEKGGLVVNMVGVCVAGGNGEPINAVQVTELPDQMESVPHCRCLVSCNLFKLLYGCLVVPCFGCDSLDTFSAQTVSTIVYN